MMLFYLSGILFMFNSMFFLIMGIWFMLFQLEVFLEWNLFYLNSVMINMLIYLDWISMLFIFTVSLISSMIMFYCVEYMSHEVNKIRFFFLVILFIFSMFLMILSPNLISIILGWDGLGLTSYCLVIYYQSYFSFNSGMLTVLMNRVGDIMIMLSISILVIMGSWNFVNILMNSNLLIFFIIIASFTKSAQFPFSSWLPAAMAAPTPVSSLVHSSTLVTAGVYLLIRFNNIIYMNNNFLNFILYVGMITMFMAGLSANFEFDFKKIIAFSTLSQLGLMMVIYSMKLFILSYFHLVIHAMFKSMMFMCSGIIIHSMINNQDIRLMGNLLEFLPLTFMILMISNFSLCGMPFLSGFYSKDLILEKIFMSKFSLILFLFLIVSTLLTLIYSVRLMYYLMNKNFYFFSNFKINDYKIMNFSLILLLLNTIFMGFLFNSMLFLNIEEIFLMKMEKLMILFLLILMMFFMNKLYYLKFNFNFFLSFMFGKMFFLNYLNFYYNNLMLMMKNYYYLFDKGMENYSEKLIYELLYKMNLNKLNNNNLLGLMLMMSFMLMFMLLI
uniref:NADH dehydrogenase subunit 5 n=1 Tax=Exoristobia philippinensis TaxID=3081681 RepID=UPI002A836DAC|nr:NADH dehydrogenase subunit 5 [Exoristobia philippinensis]WOE90354.1 NADH dehydrogenase subunit 5 [Exoristobia philippinensis]